MRTRLIVLGAVVAVFLTASAYAAPIPSPISFEFMDEGGIGETNILFGHPVQGPDLHIVGTTVHNPTAIDFDSPTLIFAKGGQSDIDPCTSGIGCTGMHGTPNGEITSLTVSVSTPGGFFHDLILDPQKTVADGDLQATVHGTLNGTPFTESSPLFGDHTNGDNFLTIETTTPGAEILSVTLTSTAGFGDLKQPRISGANGVFTPEPSSMMLLGSGVLLFAQMLRRKLL